MRLVLLFLLALPTLASAGDGGPPGGRHRGPPPHVILLDNADELGLDDATTTRIEAIAAAARPELHALHTAARSLRPEDEGFAEARAQLVEAEGALMDDIRAELTEAQWAAAEALLPPPRSDAKPAPGACDADARKPSPR
ncbi:MAG: hypothetical protein V4850_32955 [Myxococcota bacterium]